MRLAIAVASILGGLIVSGIFTGCAGPRIASFQRGYEDGSSLVRRVRIAGESRADEFIDGASRRDMYLLGVFAACDEKNQRTQQAMRVR